MTNKLNNQNFLNRITILLLAFPNYSQYLVYSQVTVVLVCIFYPNGHTIRYSCIIERFLVAIGHLFRYTHILQQKEA